jgi:hypothetical protein
MHAPLAVELDAFADESDQIRPPQDFFTQAVGEPHAQI